VPFQTPFELVETVATSSDARLCYAERWLEFAYGRKFVSADAPSQISLGASESSVREVMAAVALTPAFRKRAPEDP
jgi:hypothetical protein